MLIPSPQKGPLIGPQREQEIPPLGEVSPGGLPMSTCAGLFCYFELHSMDFIGLQIIKLFFQCAMYLSELQ